MLLSRWPNYPRYSGRAAQLATPVISFLRVPGATVWETFEHVFAVSSLYRIRQTNHIFPDSTRV